MTIIIGKSGGASSGSVPDFLTTLIFQKSNFDTPAWTVSGASLVTSQLLGIDIGGIVATFPASTAVVLPDPLVSGTDYAIYATRGGQLLADASFTAPDGADPEDVRQVGGFHVYAGTGGINPNSLWDLRFRPACPDPRGMEFEPNFGSWGDFYLLGVDHHINGTSKAGVAIASGSRLPKIPAMFGGNGTAAYSRLSWFEARNILLSHGKRLPTIPEFFAHAFGATPLIAVGSDPVNTGHTVGYRSNTGMEQAIGNLWIWSSEQSAVDSSNTWQEMSTGQGNWYGGYFRTALLGAYWGHAGNSGPDAVGWSDSPTVSGGGISARGFSDHKVF